MTTPASHHTRHLPRVFAQLVPAALVAVVGTLLLNSLAKDPSRPENIMPIVITAEAVFKATPRDRDEPVIAARADDAKSIASTLARVAVKPKPPAAGAPLQARKPVSEPVATAGPIASVSQPLPILPAGERTQPAAPSGSENALMGTLRGATASLRSLPQWAANSMSGWFAETEPPRPPAAVPVQEFRASM